MGITVAFLQRYQTGREFRGRLSTRVEAEDEDERVSQISVGAGPG